MCSVNCQLDFEIDMPPVIVSSDDMRLRQVLLNLIGNAIKFTPVGKIKVRAHVSEGSVLRIEVEDNGISIAKEDHPKLFQNLSQIAGKGAHKIGSTGLGLVISKRIITGMGGEIGVESDVGKGSIFWFELPVKVSGDAPPSTDSAAAYAPDSAGHYDARILLAEDNAINSEVAKALLESFGATVTVVENGQLVIGRLREQSFDFVIMNQQMPVMDGIAATQELRAMGCAAPMVSLTANAFAEDRQRCLDAGMDDFVAKPVTREKIAAILAQFATPAKEPDLLDLNQLEQVIDDFGLPLFEELLAQLARDGQSLLQLATDNAD
ncbi:ATP-binding protein [Yoonia sediminilitoris]|uniref:histidine kinase n=1 Tax=Yoonia sediminilitoris TaxID=1286148 RepID=A0A2T6KJT3_9RHOB|nr:ATP-binding protein [Yoonia sediminilitoris]PUB16206.1 response regulator receiver domain-containing protein [Yoonia sediminilitoris]RCW96555.1 response regulator receiver domain-containing protein [Yoonia sediminilitoris]